MTVPSKWSRENVDIMLESIERGGVNLTTWEEMFIESIRSQFSGGRDLSDKQIETLERIYAEKTP